MAPPPGIPVLVQDKIAVLSTSSEPSLTSSLNPETTNANANASSFESLPGELRMEIYYYALSIRGTITVTGCTNVCASKLNRSNALNSGQPKQNHRVFNLQCIAKPLDSQRSHYAKIGEVTGASILRVCKRFHEDASAMLYGCNTFVFTSPSAFDAFYTVANTKFHLLKHVTVLQNKVPSAIFPYAPNLATLSYRITEGKINVISFFRAIDLLTGCDSKECRAPSIWQGEKRNFLCDRCRAAAVHKKRLKAIVIPTATFRIRLKDAEAVMANATSDPLDRLDTAICYRAREVFNGEQPTMYDWYASSESAFWDSYQPCMRLCKTHTHSTCATYVPPPR